ncbi:MAG: hypothetical protein ACD_20C00104G0023 [uncultured bacterium]|nr:MAG: hypothetical protein ACD_20C00104G0023 [uncultured bacterium]HBH17710.1 hypothetical protein [Cyanobacteria bacterium UBA9579]
MNINPNIAAHNPFQANSNPVADISIPFNKNKNYQISKQDPNNSHLLFSARQIKARNPLNSLLAINKNPNKYNINQEQIDKFSNRSNLGSNLDTNSQISINSIPKAG